MRQNTPNPTLAQRRSLVHEYGMKSEIEFINHASVLISQGDVHLLSDPWYAGAAFHDGWRLLVEHEDDVVAALLKRATHIWVSHEHPDHFSVLFFKRFGEQIRTQGIKILFQNTRDRRVAKFFEAQGFDLTELPFNTPVQLSDDYAVTCIKDGFIDSGLFIETAGEKILNLNDCEVNTQQRADEIKRLTGDVEVLLTQFSYAAWKGGAVNRSWRLEAAEEKLDAVALQTKTFAPTVVIPFASYVYFSNAMNGCLNDGANHPKEVLERFKDAPFETVVMAPFDRFSGAWSAADQENAVNFWQAQFEDAATREPTTYDSVPWDELAQDYVSYVGRVRTTNNTWIMRFFRRFKPFRAFAPIAVKLLDYDKTVLVDFENATLVETDRPADLEMQSASLQFLFKNGFGFDTLMVNGCFEEGSTGGFVRATKTFGVDNLNNIGLKVAFSTLFNVHLIKMILTRLYRVARKLEE